MRVTRGQAGGGSGGHLRSRPEGRPGGPGARAGASPVRTAGAGPADPCPCASGQIFSACCEPLHDGSPAATAEALMRSRYSAFVVGDEDYLFRTWHPRTRPPGPYCHPGTQWLGLRIHEVVDGGPQDETGIVEFTARYRGSDGRGGVALDELRERSRFVRRAGRWLYLEALALPD